VLVVHSGPAVVLLTAAGVWLTRRRRRHAAQRDHP
jgi:hypothetical protein